jgi:hypothetical protein
MFVHSLVLHTDQLCSGVRGAGATAVQRSQMISTDQILLSVFLGAWNLGLVLWYVRLIGGAVLNSAAYRRRNPSSSGGSEAAQQWCGGAFSTAVWWRMPKALPEWGRRLGLAGSGVALVSYNEMLGMCCPCLVLMRSVSSHQPFAHNA